MNKDELLKQLSEAIDYLTKDHPTCKVVLYTNPLFIDSIECDINWIVNDDNNMIGTIKLDYKIGEIDVHGTNLRIICKEDLPHPTIMRLPPADNEPLFKYNFYIKDLQ